MIWIIVFHIGNGKSNLFPIFPGYRDAEGFVTLSVSLDTDPCLSVMVVTRWTIVTIVTTITINCHHGHHCHHRHHQGLLVPAQRARCVWLKSEVQGTEAAQELQVGKFLIGPGLVCFVLLLQLVLA